MGKTSTPIRIDADLYATATEAAALMGRSTAQQIAHWARVGRELEADPGVSVARVAEVLRGEASYDDARSEDQALVRAAWKERMEALVAALRLDEEFAAAGRPYSELDESGAVVRHTPVPSATTRRTAR